MLLESDKALELATRGPKSLALSVGLHSLLFLFVFMSPDFLSTTSTRIIRISGQDFDRERFDLTELVLPPELMQPELDSETGPVPEIAGVEPILPVPVPEAAPPQPPPPEPESPATPQPEIEDISPPSPIIGLDDVIEEGARPDAPPVPSEGPEELPRVVLDETTNNPGDGSGGDGLDEDSPQQALEDSDLVAQPTEDVEIAAGENSNSDALILPRFRERANTILEQNLAENRRGFVAGRRAGDIGSGDEVPDFSTDEPQILSDTRGYDFGPYMNQVVNRVRVNWYSLIPQAARLRQLRGRVVIVFTITKDGTVANERIVADSGSVPLDRAAEGAILASNPFPHVPDDFAGENLVLQFTFLYNMS